WLYVRKQDVPKIPKRFQWTFQTKLRQAADLVIRATQLLQHLGKQAWCVADGVDAKRPFVQTLLKQGVTLVGRLRKDSALFDLPSAQTQKRRGRKRVYEVNRISLAKRAAHCHGWREVLCMVFGKEVVKQFKMF